MTHRFLIVAGILLATFQMMARTDMAAAATLAVPGDYPNIASALEAAAPGFHERSDHTATAGGD